jgi:hypothetical protein
MKDVFYTILTVWIIWKIYNAFVSTKQPQNTNRTKSKEGNITLKNTASKSKHISDTEGEYVDFEEIK